MCALWKWIIDGRFELLLLMAYCYKIAEIFCKKQVCHKLYHFCYNFFFIRWKSKNNLADILCSRKKTFRRNSWCFIVTGIWKTFEASLEKGLTPIKNKYILKQLYFLCFVKIIEWVMNSFSFVVLVYIDIWLVVNISVWLNVEKYDMHMARCFTEHYAWPFF